MILLWQDFSGSKYASIQQPLTGNKATEKTLLKCTFLTRLRFLKAHVWRLHYLWYLGLWDRYNSKSRILVLSVLLIVMQKSIRLSASGSWHARATGVLEALRKGILLKALQTQTPSPYLLLSVPGLKHKTTLLLNNAESLIESQDPLSCWVFVQSSFLTCTHRYPFYTLEFSRIFNLITIFQWLAEDVALEMWHIATKHSNTVPSYYLASISFLPVILLHVNYSPDVAEFDTLFSALCISYLLNKTYNIFFLQKYWLFYF